MTFSMILHSLNNLMTEKRTCGLVDRFNEDLYYQIITFPLWNHLTR